MFEVKSARFGLLERAATFGFEEKAKSRLDNATKQLEQTHIELDAGNLEFGHIPTDRPRIGIVIGEPHYLANSHWTRDRLMAAPFPTMCAALREIEHLMSILAAEVERQLLEITSDPDRSTWLLGNALKVSDNATNPILERAWESYPRPEVLGDPANG